MLLQRKIHIKDFAIIKQQFYDYLVKKYDGAQAEIVGYISKEELGTISPELIEFFNNHNMNALYGAILIRAPHVLAPIHIDNDLEELKCELAVNLPIANCEGTLMNWFDVPTKDLEHINDRGNRYRAMPFDTDWKQVPLLDSTEIDTPTMVRIDVPHNVTNDQDKYRMLVSIRFDPQPTHMWPDRMSIWD